MLVIEFLVDGFFSFSTMLCHCLLTSVASDEKLAVDLIENLLYKISHFPLAVFKILSFFGFDSLIIMYLFEFTLLSVH